jgi:hypothetical protein
VNRPHDLYIVGANGPFREAMSTRPDTRSWLMVTVADTALGVASFALAQVVVTRRLHGT